jgi:hypothetical protein
LKFWRGHFGNKGVSGRNEEFREGRAFVFVFLHIVLFFP